MGSHQHHMHIPKICSVRRNISWNFNKLNAALSHHGNIWNHVGSLKQRIEIYTIPNPNNTAQTAQSNLNFTSKTIFFTQRLTLLYLYTTTLVRWNREYTSDLGTSSVKKWVFFPISHHIILKVLNHCYDSNVMTSVITTISIVSCDCILSTIFCNINYHDITATGIPCLF